MTENENIDDSAPNRPSLNVKLPVKLYYRRNNRNKDPPNMKPSSPPLDYSKTTVAENQIFSNRSPFPMPNPSMKNMSLIRSFTKRDDKEINHLPHKEANTFTKETNLFNEVANKSVIIDDDNSVKILKKTYNSSIINNRENSKLFQILQTKGVSNDELLVNQHNDKGDKENTASEMIIEDRNCDVNDTAVQTDNNWKITSDEYEILQNMIDRNDKNALIANRIEVDDNVIELDSEKKSKSNEITVNTVKDSGTEAISGKSEQFEALVNDIYSALTKKIIKPAFEKSLTMHTTTGSENSKIQENLKAILSQTFETISECVGEFLNNLTHNEINVNASTQTEISQTECNESINLQKGTIEDLKTIFLQNMRQVQEIKQNLMFFRQLSFAQHQYQRQYFGMPQFNNAWSQRQWGDNNMTQLKINNPTNFNHNNPTQLNQNDQTQGHNVVTENSQMPQQATLAQRENQTKSNDYFGNKNLWFGHRQHPYGNTNTRVRPQRFGNICNPPVFQQQQNQIRCQNNEWQSQDVSNRNPNLPASN